MPSASPSPAPYCSSVSAAVVVPGATCAAPGLFAPACIWVGSHAAELCAALPNVVVGVTDARGFECALGTDLVSGCSYTAGTAAGTRFTMCCNATAHLSPSPGAAPGGAPPHGAVALDTIVVVLILLACALVVAGLASCIAVFRADSMLVLPEVGDLAAAAAAALLGRSRADRVARLRGRTGVAAAAAPATAAAVAAEDAAKSRQADGGAVPADIEVFVAEYAEARAAERGGSIDVSPSAMQRAQIAAGERERYELKAPLVGACFVVRVSSLLRHADARAAVEIEVLRLNDDLERTTWSAMRIGFMIFIAMAAAGYGLTITNIGTKLMGVGIGLLVAGVIGAIVSGILGKATLKRAVNAVKDFAASSDRAAALGSHGVFFEYEYHVSGHGKTERIQHFLLVIDSARRVPQNNPVPPAVALRSAAATAAATAATAAVAAVPAAVAHGGKAGGGDASTVEIEV